MNNFKNIDSKQLNEWLQAGEAVLVDVREPNEFTEWRICQATSMPLTNFDRHVESLQGEKRKIVFQCLKGKRGEMAATAAVAQLPDAEIYNLEGGIEAWANDGFAYISDAVQSEDSEQSDSSCTKKCTMQSAMKKLPLHQQVFVVAGGLIAFFSLLGLLDFKLFSFLAFLMGGGLVYGGATGNCGLAKLLQKMPWNK